jgi:hypothetical protein
MSESDFDAFLARAWADHGDHASAVAERLRAGPVPDSPARVKALARLEVHVFGEHLGRFDEARARLDRLADLPAAADDEVRSALRVGRATLDLAQGRPEPTAGLSAAEALQAESGAAALCNGRSERGQARTLIASARRRLRGMADAPPALHRPLAIACNNMSWSLIERGAARDADDTAAMLELAQASREHWSQAGTWLEVERADYTLARASLEAGDGDAALVHAERCLAACAANEAPLFEQFYAHEALVRVHLARHDAAAAQRHLEQLHAVFERLDADDQAACGPVRAALDATPR